jgi:hypothetical protein
MYMKKIFKTHYLNRIFGLFLPSIILILLGLFFYALTVRGIYGKPIISQVKNNLDQPTKPFELSPERGRYAIIVSLAEDHRFALRPDLGMMVYPDVGFYKGKFYSFFAPGISILALPFYLLGSEYNIPQVASYFVISIIASLNLALIFLIAKRIFKMPLWASIFAALIFGFGCSAWSYAITLYQHQVTTFLILLSFFAVWKIHNKSKFTILWASLVWFNFGYAVFIDYPNVLFLAPVMIYFAYSGISASIHSTTKKIKLFIRPSVILTSIILIAWIAIHGYYNYVNFGSWKRVSGSLVGYSTIIQNKLEKETNPEQVIEAKKGQKDPIKFFSEKEAPFGLYTLFIAPDRGLFLYAPIFLFALLGGYLMLKRGDKESATLLATVGVIIFLYSSWGDPWGGWAFGPRYLIPAMAIFSLFVSYWLSNGKFKLLSRILAFGLFCYSSAVSLLGALTTSAIPPKVEGDYLGMPYNFLQSLTFYISGKSGSFVFNQYISHYTTLGIFSAALWFLLIVIVAFVLFVLPLFRSTHDH